MAAATMSSLLQSGSLKLNHCIPLRLHLPSSSPPRFTGNLTFQGRHLAKFNVRCCFLERKHLTRKNLNSNHLSFTSGHDIKTPFEIVSETILKALKGPALAAAVLLGLLLMHDPKALAASGGRMGGRSFSSRSSSSRSSSRSSSVSSSRSSSSRSNSHRGSIFSSSSSSSRSSSVPGNGGSSSSSYSTEVSVQPTVQLGVRNGLFFDWIDWTFIGILAFVFLSSVLVTFCTEEGERDTGIEKTSVLKLQVGLLGTGRSLQRDLNRIAEVADTSSSEGLRFILTETTLALLRHPDYCISGYSSVNMKQSIDDAEKCFNRLSIEERETLMRRL